MFKISAFLFNTSVDLHESPQHSVAVALSRISGDRRT